MNKVILDSSAILALLNREPGYEIVEKHLPHSAMSTVNISEVIAVLGEFGMSYEEAENITAELVKEIIDFDHPQAVLAGSLRKLTKAHGLSLGDRACLSLAKIENLSVLTADKAWNNIHHGVKVLLIR